MVAALRVAMRTCTFGLHNARLHLTQGTIPKLSFVVSKEFFSYGGTGQRSRKRKFNENQHTEGSTVSSKIEISKISEDLTIQERATNQSASEGGIKTNLKVEEKTKRKNWQLQLNWVSSDIYGNQC